MKRSILITLTIFALLLQNPVQAALPGNPDGTPGVGDGPAPEETPQCDFQKFKEALGARESGGNYQAKNQFGYLGKYQLGKLALQDIGMMDKNGLWLGKHGVSSEQEFLNSPGAQENAMNDWVDRMASEIRHHKLGNYVGQSVGPCQVTWSGLLGGRHLCGIGKSSGGGGKCHQGTSLKQYLTSGGGTVGTDGNGTPVSEYVCKFAGYKTPYDEGQSASQSCGGSYSIPPPTPLPFEGLNKQIHTYIEPDPDKRHFDAISLGLKNIWVATFQLMTEQLVTNMMHQVELIGKLFDAKHQLETQRLLQEKHAQAHKDYHPSEQMCTIGTAVRDLANTSQRADLTKTTISNILLDRALATGDTKTYDIESDQITRRRAYKEKFCTSKDNSADNQNLCEDTAEPEQINADINFTQSIDTPLTLQINLLDSDIQPDEENVFALLDYIFMHDRFPWISGNKARDAEFVAPYQDMRSLIAIRSVAQNSFAEIIGQKTEGPGTTGDTAAPFIKALMKELGVAPDDIETEIGKNPSYYAQMEVLTKKIYQHPEFVSNLYDKPTNVKRMIAAMTAIKVMQDRDIHEALMRREMLMSMLLEINLRYEQQDLENLDIQRVLSKFSGGSSDGGGGGGKF